MKRRPHIDCACCDTYGPHAGRGLIEPCHRRHSNAGTLHQWPTRGSLMLDRYQQLASIRPTPSVERLAFELGVSPRQVERYAAATRATSTGSEVAA